MEVFIKVTVVLICAHNSCDVPQWMAHTVDQLLTEGDVMYQLRLFKRKLFQTQRQSPDRVRCSAIITYGYT